MKRTELPNGLKDRLFALMCDDDEFYDHWALRVWDDGQIKRDPRKEIVLELWMTICDLLELAALPNDATKH